QERGNSFGGESVISIYATPFLTFDSSTIRKSARTITTYYKLNGSASISLKVNFNWDQLTALNPENYIQEEISNSVQYNQSFKYDQGHKYAGGTVSPVITTNIEGSGDSMQFIF